MGHRVLYLRAEDVHKYACKNPMYVKGLSIAAALAGGKAPGIYYTTDGKSVYAAQLPIKKPDTNPGNRLFLLSP